MEEYKTEECRVGQWKTEEGGEKQWKAEEGREKQWKAEEGGAEQWKTEKSRKEPCKAVQRKTEQGMSEPPQEQRTIAERIFCAFRALLYIMIGIYMVLILVVLPFYNSEGYAHIGTDKAEFLLKSAIYCGGALLPVLILTGIAKIIVLLQKYGWTAWYDLDYPQVADYFRKRFSMTDCFALSYGVSVLVSYMCSDYREEALWGTEYWYMGMVTQLALVTIYFLVSRARFGQKWIAMLVLPVSAVVFVLGFLNRFGIYPIDMKINNVQFVSTIGNINWYCGYLMSIFFGGFYVFCQSEGQRLWQRLLLGIYVVIGFATLVTQGSSSGIVTLVVLLLVLFRRFAAKGLWMMNFWKGMTILSFVCLVTYILRQAEMLEITYVETTTELFTNGPLSIVMTIVSVSVLLILHWCKKKIGYPRSFFESLTRRLCMGMLILLGLFVVLMLVNTLGNGVLVDALFEMTGMSFQGILTFSPTWGSNRGATWMAGMRCFAEQDILHMLVGVGPDCMAAFLYGDGSEELVTMVQNCFGTARLTNAHNEWLTVLVNTGLFGLASFVGMMTSAIRRFLSNKRDRNCNSSNGTDSKMEDSTNRTTKAALNNELFAAACGFCLLAYTVNNMFSFQQAMNVSTIFVVLGMGESVLRRRKLESVGVGNDVWEAGREVKRIS